MLEILSRSGGGRIVAWTRDGVVVHTPVVLARPAPGVPEGFGLLVGAAVPAALPLRRPAVQVVGGFHLEPADEVPATPAPLWAHVAVDRPRRIAGQLSLRRGRPASPFATDDDEDAERQAAPGIPDIEPVLSADGEVAMLAEAASLARDPGVLMPLLGEARQKAGPGRLLYAPGVGLVHHLALLSYAGVDVTDTLALERATLDGIYCTPEGAFPAASLAAPLCACAVCRATAPSALSSSQLLAHNLAALDAERVVVSGHIRNGTLRELVEMRARAHPATAAALRHLDLHARQLVRDAPLVAKGPLHATTMESLQRPDVVRFRERVANGYSPPAGADVLLLLPCSAAKPYSRSKTHRVFQRVLGDLHAAALVHEVIVTSPLGVVPRELEHTWPAAHYDVPVTGHWDLEEAAMIRAQLSALLAHGPYRTVISHLPAKTHALVADLLPAETPHTAVPSSTAYAARDALRAALHAATKGRTAPVWPRRRLADARALASWQFGPDAADALLSHAADVQGRPPHWRVLESGGRDAQVGAFVPDRGLLSLTLLGARRLLEGGKAKVVEIDDFIPKGTLFSVGVRAADPTIAPGDEVVLVHDGQLRGVGPAVATGREMTALRRGAAVEVRHHV